MHYRRRRRRTLAELALGPVRCVLCPTITNNPCRGRCPACYRRTLRAEQRGAVIDDPHWRSYERRGAA